MTLVKIGTGRPPTRPRLEEQTDMIPPLQITDPGEVASPMIGESQARVSESHVA